MKVGFNAGIGEIIYASSVSVEIGMKERSGALAPSRRVSSVKHDGRERKDPPVDH